MVLEGVEVEVEVGGIAIAMGMGTVCPPAAAVTAEELS